MGEGTLRHAALRNSPSSPHTSSPRTVETAIPCPPTDGGSPCEAQAGERTGVRNAVSASTGTSMKVVGSKHLAAMVIDRLGPRLGSSNTATPPPSVDFTIP